MDKVRCRPDDDVANLKTAIKEKFKPQLDKWSPAQLTLKFNGTILKAHEMVTVIHGDEDEAGEPIPVTVHTP